MAEDEMKDCREVDEHLTPFVDGEEPPATRRSIAAHLAACPPCRTHADAEASARDIVRDHRDELRAAAPASLRARCASLSTSGADSPAFAGERPAQSFIRRWAPLSVAATLVLAVAGVFLFGLNNPVEALAASLALDHAKCFKIGDVHAHADPAAEEHDWRQGHGWDIVVPKALPDEQLQLVDVRHCLSSDGRAAHLMYTWHGTPLSVYVLPADSGHAGEVTRMRRTAVMWCANQRTYAVVAEGQPRDLTRIVSYLKSQVR